MTDRRVFFNDVLPAVAALVDQTHWPAGTRPLVIRDIYGKVRLAIDLARCDCEGLAGQAPEALRRLGLFAGEAAGGILCREDFFNPAAIFDSPDRQDVWLPERNLPLQLLDRQLVGQDWVQPRGRAGDVPTVAFFGLKGGVGRTTALALAARDLAGDGKTVLVLDLDLESPGLAALLLPPDQYAEFGIVDWLVEDAVGQGDAVLDRLVVTSPLSDQVGGSIRVAGAVGLEEGWYLPKLSRAYADIPGDAGPERFSARLARLLHGLRERERPDVILIDSRAGLNDLAAISIVGLSTDTLLFATDSPQTWQGYRLLFEHWRHYPKVLQQVRERLQIVDALFPEQDQTARAERFLEHSWELFQTTLYDDLPPGASPEDTPFSFDLADEAGPHHPLRIKWNSRFQELSFALLGDGILTDADIASGFGDFLNGLRARIGWLDR